MKEEHGGEGSSRPKVTQGTLDAAAPKGVFKPLAHHSNEGWVQQDTVYRGWTQTSREEQDVFRHWWCFRKWTERKERVLRELLEAAEP